jgi:AcrR family transcriptional regulator
MTRRPSPALPPFVGRNEREQAVLEASRAVVGLFVRERSSDFSVKELAEHTGLSERTFYRYFPRKEDAVRPYIEAGLEHVLSRVRQAPRDRSLRDVLVSAHGEILDLALPLDGAAFLQVVNQTERLRAVWLQVLTDAEAAFAGIVADWLGIEAESVQARFVSAAVVTAGRLALQSAGDAGMGRDPSQVFAECVDLLGPALLPAPQGTSRR